MGRGSGIDFTEETIKNRQLILEMLKWEDQFYFSPQGQSILSSFGDPTTSLDGMKAIQRLTLTHYNFNSSDQSLASYRRIFYHYYKDHNDYDHDIINSVYYLRENRILYYISPQLNIGDKIPDVTLYTIDGKEMSLYSIINDVRGINDKNIIDIDELEEKNEKDIVLASFSLS